jgi:hypothetical protein
MHNYTTSHYKFPLFSSSGPSHPRLNEITKSIPGVNFTNILRAAFLYKSFAPSFFVLAVKVKLFIGTRILAQMHFKNVGEIDSRACLIENIMMSDGGDLVIRTERAK